MSRILVEGHIRNPQVVTFPGVAPVIIQPGPVPGNVQFPVTKGEEPTNDLVNLDTVAHSWRAFLRGTGSPGGGVELTAPGLPAPIGPLATLVTQNLGSGLGFPNFLPRDVATPADPLRIELEMQEGIGAGPPPVFTAPYEDVLDQLITVPGHRFGAQVALVNNLAPNVLAGPPAGASKRTVLGMGNAENALLASISPFDLEAFGHSFFINRDNLVVVFAPKTVIVTLQEGGQPDQVIARSIVGGVAENDLFTDMPNVELLPGQQLEFSVVEATTANDPLLYWVFFDSV